MTDTPNPGADFLPPELGLTDDDVVESFEVVPDDLPPAPPRVSGFDGIGTRRESRERALALLYEAEQKGLVPLAGVVDTLPLPPEPFAGELVVGVSDHVAELDELIGRYSVGWTIARMPAIDRTLLRIGTFELGHTDVPVGACISEAVELAKRYSTDDSHKFVNGLLSRIAAELRDGNGERLAPDLASTAVADPEPEPEVEPGVVAEPEPEPDVEVVAEVEPEVVAEPEPDVDPAATPRGVTLRPWRDGPEDHAALDGLSASATPQPDGPGLDRAVVDAAGTILGAAWITIGSEHLGTGSCDLELLDGADGVGVRPAVLAQLAAVALGERSMVRLSYWFAAEDDVARSAAQEAGFVFHGVDGSDERWIAEGASAEHAGSSSS